MAFGIQTTLYSLQSQALTFCAISHKHSQARLHLPGFSSLRSSFSCIIRTNVVSFLKLLGSIFVPSTSIYGLVWLALGNGFLYLVVSGLGCPSSFASARVFFAQVQLLLHYSYERGKLLETPWKHFRTIQ